MMIAKGAMMSSPVANTHNVCAPKPSHLWQILCRCWTQWSSLCS